MNELEAKRNKTYKQSYQLEQSRIDPEKRYHNPNLYAVWNLKHYIMEHASIVNHFNSKFFIFTDGGAWRGQRFTNWPDQSFVQRIANYVDDRIIYGQVARSFNQQKSFWSSILSNNINDCIQGFFTQFKENII